MVDAGFEPGTSASEVWHATNEPPHLPNEPPHLPNEPPHLVDVVAHFCRCGGSLVARQTSGAEVPGSNPASTTMILMRCRIIV